MIKAVIFDLDGTLINTLEDLADSVNYSLKVDGFSEHPTERFKYFVGNGMAKLIERVLPNGTDEKQIKRTLDIFMDYYKEHFTDKSVVYDGVLELLDILRNSGIKTAVVSNKAHIMTLEIVDKLLKGKFDVVCGKIDNLPAKPDPTTTLSVLKKLGVDADECLFVGDSGVDMITASNSGIKSVGVLWGFRTEEELLENGADFIIDTPLKLLDLIK